MRDFSAAMMQRRNYLTMVLQTTFERYGYGPLATPAMERLEVLEGKYGEAADPLLFKVLNSGYFLSGVTSEDLNQGLKAAQDKITSKGLRYDLTIPLARYVAQHRHQLTFPFKRYQMQPVWRADRPQRGRYREFLQSDVDVLGSPSLTYEAELLAMAHDIFDTLHIKDFEIALNHRLLLRGIARLMGVPEREEMLCRELDKLDKIGVNAVCENLKGAGIDEVKVAHMRWLFGLKGSIGEVFTELEASCMGDKDVLEAIAALQKILNYLAALGVSHPNITIVPTLARGIAYYTGAIFEVVLPAEDIGSVGGGGRYDDLTAIFGLKGTTGVGFSFGFDRIYDVLERRQGWPTQQTTSSLLVVPLTQELKVHALGYLAQLRSAGITSMAYPIPHIKKALAYAQKTALPWVALVGEDEAAAGKLMLKNMGARTQQLCSLEELVDIVAPSGAAS
jgi:histidyl-tRNA synthetase